MTILCLHHNDADGRASAAIVRRALGSQVILHEMNYGELIPWEKAEGAEKIIVVDFSLPEKDMEKLAEGRRFIWIDHHISAIQELREASKYWEGVREIHHAACVLTWHYFFPDQALPRAIFLIGDRDAWHWTEEDTGPFSEALNQEDTDPQNDALWDPLLEGDPELLQSLIERGSILREAQLNEVQRRVNEYGFPIRFEGHRAIAINIRGNGDIGVYAGKLGYPLAYCYIDNCQNGNLITFVGLYSSEIDVSEIARKFGGGGHKGAAGFSFPRGATPFPSDSDADL